MFVGLAGTPVLACILNPASGAFETPLDRIAFVCDLEEHTVSAALVDAFHYFGRHPAELFIEKMAIAPAEIKL